MSSDEDIRSTISQKINQAKRPNRLHVGGTQHADTEAQDEDFAEVAKTSKVGFIARHLLHASSGDFAEAAKTSKVGFIARHLLHASSGEKDGALKDVLAQKLYCLTRKEYPSVLREVSRSLERTFGCKVVHRSCQSHIVLMEHIEENYPYDLMAQAKKGLLSAILMFIFACKSKRTNVISITETVLLNFLKALGLTYEVPDPIFGDIKKLISPMHTAEFIYQGYISFSKSSDRCETQVFTYDWGPRATLALLGSFCSIMKDPEVDKWSNQVETMKHLEEEKKQIMIESEKYMCDSK
ncbi:MAGE family protein [Dictyocaulus viviparus]|uniref:MAGE family protein n=1 Tax=Dictyocaulus viviparus TaxID=29172 RepID=A0A0D8Y182_DICVI|nr:MAGE family protein [Dictyocaulus viviparus]